MANKPHFKQEAHMGEVWKLALDVDSSRFGASLADWCKESPWYCNGKNIRIYTSAGMGHGKELT